MPTTTHGLPYPLSSAAPNIPSDMQALANAVDAALGRAGAGLQEGVIDAGSFMATQKGAGANMSVDVASSSGTGAYVKDDTISGQGLQYIAPFTTTNVAIGANASGNPRVDRVVLSTAGVVSVVAGTATSGATLNNLTGAASVPSSSLLLADVLVANGAASITNSVIRDRRTWARGAYVQIVRNANAVAGNDYTTTTTTVALIDSTNLAPRIECTGIPVRVRLVGTAQQTTTANLYVIPEVDSTGVNGMANVGDNIGTALAGQSIGFNSAALGNALVSFTWEFVPAAGSHIIAPAWATTAGTQTLNAKATRPMLWIVEELVCQNSANNTTTTG